MIFVHLIGILQPLVEGESEYREVGVNSAGSGGVAPGDVRVPESKNRGWSGFSICEPPNTLEEPSNPARGGNPAATAEGIGMFRV